MGKVGALRRFRSVVLAACALAVVAPSARAGWLPAQPLSAVSGLTQSPRVDYDAHGGGVAVWFEGSGATNMGLMASTRDAGGAWSAPTALSVPTANPGSPSLAVNHRGDAVVVWMDGTGPSTYVRARFRPAGGSWGPTRELSAVSDVPAGGTTVALDESGDALAAWTVTASGRFSIQTAWLAAGAAQWQAAAPLTSLADDDRSPSAAFAPDGQATVLWSHTPSGGTRVVRSRTRATDGTWSAPTDVPSSTGGAGTQLAIDSSGNATAVWYATSGTLLAFGSFRPAGARGSRACRSRRPGPASPASSCP